ncbi:MAG: ABC transporter substrate-binding protein [Actinomycetota bacterium]
MAVTPLRLGGVPEHFNLPWHLALASGRLDDLEPTWTDQPGGTGDLLAALADGSLDLVSILTEGTISAIAGGLPASVIQVYVSSPLQWGVFVPAASDLHDESALAGRPIAISRFRSGSHLMAYVQARRMGWELTADQFVVTGGLEGARAAFAEGRAEVFLWDRFMTRPLVATGEFRQVAVQATPWPSFVLAATNEALTGRTAEVGRVVDEVVAQAVGLHQRPGVVGELAGRYGLDRATVEEWLGATTFAPRQSWDADIGRTVRATLADAGLS